MRTHDDGFTLLELLVVMVIIAVLAAIAIPSFLNQKGRAQAGRHGLRRLHQAPRRERVDGLRQRHLVGDEVRGRLRVSGYA